MTRDTLLSEIKKKVKFLRVHKLVLKTLTPTHAGDFIFKFTDGEMRCQCLLSKAPIRELFMIQEQVDSE